MSQCFSRASSWFQDEAASLHPGLPRAACALPTQVPGLTHTHRYHFACHGVLVPPKVQGHVRQGCSSQEEQMPILSVLPNFRAPSHCPFLPRKCDHSQSCCLSCHRSGKRMNICRNSFKGRNIKEVGVLPSNGKIISFQGH